MTQPTPTIAACLGFFDDYEMLPNIKEHSHIVARVAEAVFSKLQERGFATLPHKNVVIAGALLHDIAKTDCLKNGCDHASVGADICDTLGYPHIAEIVREHVRLVDFARERYERGVFLAKEIVYYSDKRVLADTIVDLPARLEYILERYGKNDPRKQILIRKNFKQCQELEDWLCQAAGCSNLEIVEQVSTHPFDKEC